MTWPAPGPPDFPPSNRRCSPFTFFSRGTIPGHGVKISRRIRVARLGRRAVALDDTDRFRVRLPEVLERPAGEQDPALAREKAGFELYLLPAIPLRQEPRLPGLDGLADGLYLPRIALLYPLVIVLVPEEERQDALGDQVPAVDTGEALGDDRAYAEVKRGEGRVLPRGALPVVVPADDETAAPIEGAVVEPGVLPAEHVLRAFRDIGPQAHPQGAVGGHVPCRDVVLDHYDDAPFERLGERPALGWGDDVRASDDLGGPRLVLRGRVQYLAVVQGRVGGRGRDGRGRPKLAGIGDLTRERRRGGRRRRAEVDLVAVRPAAAREVAVEGSHRRLTPRRSLPDADTGAADGLEHPRAGGDEVLVDAAPRYGVQNLARSRRDRHLHAGVHYVLPEDGRHGGEVLIRGVHRGADAHLHRLRARDVAHRHHVARGGRLRDQRLELSELDDLALVVGRAVVRGEGGVVFLAPLGGEPLAGLFIAREDGGRGAQLGDHVADRAPVRHRERTDALPGEFEDPPHAATHPVAPQELEDHVLGLDPVGQLPTQFDLDDLRTLQREAVARHRHGHVKPAGPDGEHPECAGHGGVRVGTDQEPSGPGEAFEVDVVRDAVAGTGVGDAVASRE